MRKLYEILFDILPAIFIAIVFIFLVQCSLPLETGNKAEANAINSCNTSYNSHENSYYFCGVIDSVSVDKVLAIENLKTLTITSTGGVSIQAIRLADYINEQNVQLIVKKYCLSACAHFLVLGTDNVFVDENSIVGFHHTSASLYMRLSGREFIKNTKFECKRKFYCAKP